MKSDYKELSTQIESAGVNRADAKKAVNNCLKSMVKQGGATYFAGGVVMYFANTNPMSAFGYGMMSAGLGAGNALLRNDQCARVRQALDFWSTSTD